MAAIVFIRVSAVHDEEAADGVVILSGNYVNNLQAWQKNHVNVGALNDLNCKYFFFYIRMLQYYF